MLIDGMLNQGAAPVLEQMLKFTSARQQLLAEDVANVSTPGFVQKDLSPARFQALLRRRIEDRDAGPRDGELGDATTDVENSPGGILFHDRNNRSIEQLMTAGMKNALTHNLMVELLKRQFATMELALKDKP